MPLTLYEHPFALYCQKVIVALHERGLAFEAKVESADFTREDLAELWPMASIPVLRDGDRVVPETSVIIEYLDGLEAPGPRLVTSLEARLWDRFCDGYVATPVQTVVGDTFRETPDAEGVAGARATLDRAYAALESQLDGRDWLTGADFTIADCAAAPALFYALAIHRWDEDSHRNLTRYYRALARRPSFRQVIDAARPYRDLFPLPWPEDVDRHHL
jgi:glutathione S-transferase